MSDTNVVDFAKYKKDPLVDQPVRITDVLTDDTPESFQLVDTIGTYLFDEKDLLVSKDGPTLFIKIGDNEYGLTIRSLDGHMENFSLWVDHIARKWGSAVARARKDEPVDCTAEETLILNSIFDDSDESQGG